MAREITVDTDTLVGYNYEFKYYYVTNKETTTERETAEEIKAILDIVDPAHSVSLERIQNLSTMVEPLEHIYYTWEDTGAYIKTVQLNTYKTHPITLDLEVQKLYVMNSDLIFDLTLNEAKNYRVPYLINYFQDTLGLTVTEIQMNSIYDKLLSFYSPNYYAVIQPREDVSQTLFYTNTIKLSNYNNTAPLSLTLTYNPNNLYPEEDAIYLADITYINPNTRTIQLRSSVPSQLQVEDKVMVTDSTVGEYTANGIYTVQGIDTEANIIQVEEPIVSAYEVQYLTCYKVVSKTTISSINRDNFTITLPSAVPNTIVIGDIIHLKGTTQTSDSETVTADGTYTVANISGSTIIVSEQLPINYTGSTAYIYKQIPIGYIQTIEVTESYRHVNLYSTPTTLLVQSDLISIYDTVYTVREDMAEGSTQISLYLTSQPDLDNYTQPFAKLKQPVQQPYTEVTVSESTLTNIPDGSFIVDTFEQAIGYTSLLYAQTTLPAGLEQCMSNRVATGGAIQVLSTTTPITIYIVGQSLGLYSEVYIET